MVMMVMMVMTVMMDVMVVMEVVAMVTVMVYDAGCVATAGDCVVTSGAQCLTHAKCRDTRSAAPGGERTARAPHTAVRGDATRGGEANRSGQQECTGADGRHAAKRRS